MPIICKIIVLRKISVLFMVRIIAKIIIRLISLVVALTF